MLIQSLETAKNTLLNTQIQIQIANHNISRAEDKDYHRQKVMLETGPTIRYGGLYIGTGARIQQIKRYADTLLENRFFLSVAREEEYKVRSKYLEILNAYTFDDGEKGLSVSLQKFWNSWDVLNENPGEAEKQNVKSSAEYLAQQVSETHRSLKELQQDIDKELGLSIDRANELIDLIVAYNGEIARAEVPNTGIKANDLRDKRYAAVKELAEYLPVAATEYKDSSGNLKFKVEVKYGSQTLVLIDDQNALHVNHDGNGNFSYSDNTTDAAGNDITSLIATHHPDDLDGGKLLGLHQAYSTAGNITSQLEDFAQNLANEVNSTHGSTVFNYDATAPDILTVATGFTPDPNKALDVSNLQDTSISGLGNITFAEYLSSLQYNIGKEHENVLDNQNLYGTLRTHLQEQQQAISGISLDEELVDIIKFQHIFQAAARVIRTTSEMLDTVVNMV